MRPDRTIGETAPWRTVLVLGALTLIGWVLLLPLVVLFVEAFSAGADAFIAAVTDPDAAASVRLTLLAGVALLTIALRAALEWRQDWMRQRGSRARLAFAA